MNKEELYEQMLNDVQILDTYSQISATQQELGRFSTHDFSHILRVIDNCEKIASALKLSNSKTYDIKIAALLHDIGSISKDKSGHAERSYEWAKDYLADKHITDHSKKRILTAIREHSDRASNLCGKVLTFADKMDVNKDRVLPQGLLTPGNRQYAHIIDTHFEIKNKHLNVYFETDGKLDKDEMNEYYFTHKIHQATEDLAFRCNLFCDIYVDGEILPKLNTEKSWRDLYTKEVRDNYNDWEEYVNTKFALKKNFFNMILKNNQDDKPILEAGCGTGKLSVFLAQKGLKAYAMDIDPNMLLATTELSKKHSLDNMVEIVEGDINQIPFDDNFFSVTHSSGVLEHFDDEQIINLIQEQLRVSDKMIFAVPSQYFNEEQKMLGDERFLPRKKWRNLIQEANANILREAGCHYSPLLKRIMELPSNPQRLLHPVANMIFEIESAK